MHFVGYLVSLVIALAVPGVKWSKSCVLIGCPSGQNEPILPARNSRFDSADIPAKFISFNLDIDSYRVAKSGRRQAKLGRKTHKLHGGEWLSGDLCKSGPRYFASEKSFSLKLCPINYLW